MNSCRPSSGYSGRTHLRRKPGRCGPVFYRSGIFKSSASRKIVTKTDEISGTNLIGINNQQGEVKEVHFVAMRDGWDSFEGGYGLGGALTDYTFLPVSRGVRLCMVGSFFVEP